MNLQIAFKQKLFKTQNNIYRVYNQCTLSLIDRVMQGLSNSLLLIPLTCQKIQQPEYGNKKEIKKTSKKIDRFNLFWDKY